MSFISLLLSLPSSMGIDSNIKLHSAILPICIYVLFLPALLPLFQPRSTFTLSVITTTDSTFYCFEISSTKDINTFHLI